MPCPHGDYRSCVVDGCLPLRKVRIPGVLVLPPTPVACMWCGGGSERGQCAPCAALLEAVCAASAAGLDAILETTRSTHSVTSPGWYSTYRVDVSCLGYDRPWRGIPSLDVAKAIMRDQYRGSPWQVDSQADPWVVVLGPLRAPLVRGGQEVDRELLGFRPEHDPEGWIGLLQEEVRCTCCRRVAEIRPIFWDQMRDEASGGQLGE